jgi:hypothetical protein
MIIPSWSEDILCNLIKSRLFYVKTALVLLIANFNTSVSEIPALPDS